jgi:CheY-like chemotaxis protein
MAQLAASIVSHDEEFKRQVAALLRGCGVPVGIVEERRPGVESAGPDVVVIDIRGDASSGMAAIERLRAGHPTVALFAIAASAEPDLILQAMRAGANEFFPWSQAGSPAARTMEESFHSAAATATRHGRIRRCAAAVRHQRLFGAKGGGHDHRRGELRGGARPADEAADGHRRSQTLSR